jgi:hypothetical protein
MPPRYKKILGRINWRNTHAALAFSNLAFCLRGAYGIYLSFQWFAELALNIPGYVPSADWRPKEETFQWALEVRSSFRITSRLSNIHRLSCSELANSSNGDTVAEMAASNHKETDSPRTEWNKMQMQLFRTKKYNSEIDIIMYAWYWLYSLVDENMVSGRSVYIGTTWRWVVNCTPRPLYPGKRSWVSPRAGLDAVEISKIMHCWESKPGLSAHNPSPYRLSCLDIWISGYLDMCCVRKDEIRMYHLPKRNPLLDMMWWVVELIEAFKSFNPFLFLLCWKNVINFAMATGCTGINCGPEECYAIRLLCLFNCSRITAFKIWLIALLLLDYPPGHRDGWTGFRNDTKRTCSRGGRQKVKGVMKGRSLRRKTRRRWVWAIKEEVWEILHRQWAMCALRSVTSRGRTGQGPSKDTYCLTFIAARRRTSCPQ